MDEYKVKKAISVVILTKNEELAIKGCIESASMYDQIIVLDSDSDDLTCEISRNLGAQVINFSWNKNYPKKKQWALELKEVRNEWILLLDADERITTNLELEISEFIAREDIESYGAARANLSYHFSSKKLSHGHRVNKVFLINKNKCNFPTIDDLQVLNMWEVEGHYQPIVKGKVYKFHSLLEHIDPGTLYDYFSRHNRYSDWEAYLETNPQILNQVSNSRSTQGKIFNKVPFKPLVFFLYSYFIRQGWKDKQAGFDYAVAQSFYYWLISAKRREISNHAKTKDMKES